MSKGKLIITGADGALGSVVSKKLLEEGWSLYSNALHQRSADRLQELFPEYMNKQLYASIGDLSNNDAVENLIHAAGEIRGLVHLAGGYAGGNSILHDDSSSFESMWRLNTLPTFLLLRSVFPVLKQYGGGSIVTIGAKPAIRPMAGNIAYAASKSSVVTMTLAVAEEGKPFHVRANVIVPATLQTPNNLSWADAEMFQKFTPLDHVAGNIAFLMDDASAGVSGTVIPMYNQLPW
ncbi:MAG: SDR family NAD(P)-dependent oxidoreductase [Chitinophagales bacterium]